MDVKDALELYENGKHRRYGLLFTVNGGAFAVAKIFTEQCTNVLGGLSLKNLSVGMILFTLVMGWDIYEFGKQSRKEPTPEVFGGVGKAVLLLLVALICAGWLLVGFCHYQCIPPPAR
jgi:purine-cytosine permease-like protein